MKLEANARTMRVKSVVPRLAQELIHSCSKYSANACDEEAKQINLPRGS